MFTTVTKYVEKYICTLYINLCVNSHTYIHIHGDITLHYVMRVIYNI